MKDTILGTLTLYMPNFSVGGVEVMTLKLAASMMNRGFAVTLLVHNMEGELALHVPKGVRVVSLNTRRTLGAFLPLVRYLRWTQPDVLMSNLDLNNIIAILARFMAGKKTRVVITQHNSLRPEAQPRKWQFKVVPLVYRLLLRFADGVVAVSEGIANELVKVGKISRDRVTVIHNGVIDDEFKRRMGMVANHRWITDNGAPFLLAIGRLEKEKDFETLLNAFALVRQNKKIRLIILGEGTQGWRLQDKARALGVAEDVSFPGFETNPMPFMRHAAALVMSSRFEGFGNVLVEGLACGTQIVSTDCPHGPAEILDGGRFGELVAVGDHIALAAAILRTLERKPNQQALIERGMEFSSERASSLYENLLHRLRFGSEASTTSSRGE